MRTYLGRKSSRPWTRPLSVVNSKRASTTTTGSSEHETTASNSSDLPSVLILRPMNWRKLTTKQLGLTSISSLAPCRIRTNMTKNEDARKWRSTRAECVLYILKLKNVKMLNYSEWPWNFMGGFREITMTERDQLVTERKGSISPVFLFTLSLGNQKITVRSFAER